MSELYDDDVRRALWEASGDGCDTEASARRVQARVRRIRRRRMDVAAVALLSAIVVTLGIAARSSGDEPAERPTSVETPTTASTAVPSTAAVTPPAPPEPAAPPDAAPAAEVAPAAEAAPEEPTSAVEPPPDTVAEAPAAAPAAPAPARTPASTPVDTSQTDRQPTSGPRGTVDDNGRRAPATTTTAPDRWGSHRSRSGDFRDGSARR